MANPWHPDNRPNSPEGPGGGGEQAEAADAEAEERGGNKEKNQQTPHLQKKGPEIGEP